MRQPTRIQVTRNRLPQMAARMHEALQAAVQETAEAILEQAKTLVPVDTGRLKGTLQIEEPEGAEALERVVSAGEPTEESPEGAPYAIFQELGTVKMPAQAFLTPAGEGERGAFEARMREAMRKAVE